jgi:tetratricopeptide (TPR) repeat protein
VIYRKILMLALIIVLFSCAGPERKSSLQMPYDDRIQLASIYIQSGKSDQAVVLLENATIQDKDRPQAWAMLGEISYSEGDLDEAASHLERALEAGGENPEILNNLAWVQRARGDAARALTLVDRALLLKPEPRYAYLDTRARILGKLERYEEALTDARAARDLVPNQDSQAAGDLNDLIAELETLASGGAEKH